MDVFHELAELRKSQRRLAEQVDVCVETLARLEVLVVHRLRPGYDLDDLPNAVLLDLMESTNTEVSDTPMTPEVCHESNGA